MESNFQMSNPASSQLGSGHSPLLQVSARLLGVLEMDDFCERCFYLRLHCKDKFPFQIQPPSIFSTIHSYVKDTIHRYFDKHRQFPSWFPDAIKKIIEDEKVRVGRFLNGKELHHSNFYFLHKDMNIKLTGSPDDIFHTEDGYYIIDYKTAKKTDKQSNILPLYAVQLSAYKYIAEKLGYSPVSKVFLVYLEPKTDEEAIFEVLDSDEFRLSFDAVAVKEEEIKPKNSEEIEDLLRKVREIYDKDTLPEGRKGCENCLQVERFYEILQTKGKR